MQRKGTVKPFKYGATESRFQNSSTAFEEDVPLRFVSVDLVTKKNLQKIDVDLHAFLFEENGDYMDCVFYKNPILAGKSIRLEGHAIKFDLKYIPQRCSFMVCTLAVYCGGTLLNLADSSVMLKATVPQEDSDLSAMHAYPCGSFPVDDEMYTDITLGILNLNTNTKLNEESGLLFCLMTRHEGFWYFKPVMLPVTAFTPQGLMDPAQGLVAKHGINANLDNGAIRMDHLIQRNQTELPINLSSLTAVSDVVTEWVKHGVSNPLKPLATKSSSELDTLLRSGSLREGESHSFVKKRSSNYEIDSSAQKPHGTTQTPVDTTDQVSEASHEFDLEERHALVNTEDLVAIDSSPESRHASFRRAGQKLFDESSRALLKSLKFQPLSYTLDHLSAMPNYPTPNDGASLEDRVKRLETQMQSATEMIQQLQSAVKAINDNQKTYVTELRCACRNLQEYSSIHYTELVKGQIEYNAEVQDLRNKMQGIEQMVLLNQRNSQIALQDLSDIRVRIAGQEHTLNECINPTPATAKFDDIRSIASLDKSQVSEIGAPLARSTTEHSTDALAALDKLEEHSTKLGTIIRQLASSTAPDGLKGLDPVEKKVLSFAGTPQMYEALHNLETAVENIRLQGTGGDKLY